jgi:threonylcarbamoyladenosine tRNA methylthiotransferase MtaB
VRFYVQNFGCRATQADGAAIERQFDEHGLERAADAAHAEVVVLNTCTVTSAADQDARAAIRRVHRENSAARIVVTGCYAQRAPDELAALPGVAQVVGNSHKHRLVEIALPDVARGSGWPQEPARSETGFVSLASLATSPADEKASVFVTDIFAHTELLAAPVFDAANERTRPNLKVQDGCDNRCSFCVIPFVRGQSRSSPLERILEEVNTLVAAGFRELVISGINLGRWGRDLDTSLQLSAVSSQFPAVGMTSISTRSSPVGARSLRFEDLVHAILARTRLEKLRISSVEPMDWSDELIALVSESPRIAKHAHVPLQSGSDAVLRRMHRKYRPWHYRERVEKIRAAMPGAAIGADVMVGFPGETDAEFEETRRMVEALPFTYLHVFTYSARPGTPAAHMEKQVPARVARERNRILRDLAAEKKRAFMKSFIGKTVEAITLHGSTEELKKACEAASAAAVAAVLPFDGAYTEALTDNYLKLQVPGRHEANRWVAAHIESLAGETLTGRIAAV